MDKKIEKSFDFAVGLIKQIITLSTSIIALTVTASKFIFANAPQEAVTCMIYSWISFVLAILFGIFCLMSLTGNLGSSDAPSINNAPIRFFAGVSLFLFGTGLVFAMRYAFLAWGTIA